MKWSHQKPGLKSRRQFENQADMRIFTIEVKMNIDITTTIGKLF